MLQPNGIRPFQRTAVSQQPAADAPSALGALPRVTPGRKIVGIFGGSLDPISKGHAERIRELATTYKQDVLGPDGKPAKRRLDGLLVQPVFQHYYPEKRADMASYPDRIAMANIVLGDLLGPASADKAAVSISTIEQQLGGVSRTYDTLAALKARNPNTDFVLYLGSDIRDEIDKWYRFDAITKMATVQFTARGGYDNSSTAGKVVTTASSTDIRHAIARGDWTAAERMCDPRVLAYIKRHPDIIAHYVHREAKAA